MDNKNGNYYSILGSIGIMKNEMESTIQQAVFGEMIYGSLGWTLLSMSP